MASDQTLLVENGGHISITRGWADSLPKRMGYVKRKPRTKTRNLSDKQFEEKKSQFLQQILGMVWEHEIPDFLIMDWDQTGIQLIPSGNWTLEDQGTKRVEIAGINIKRMVTATFTNNLSGHFLPMQILYSGKTSRCHPHFSEFPPGFDI